MPMSTLIAVKGRDAHPFYQYLKATTGFSQHSTLTEYSLGRMARS